MPRTHFINPYTFIPLAANGPMITKYDQSTHALFQEETFTGKIRCRLTLFTPTVIPGGQESGTTENPGHITTYTHNGRLAIPGSRLRGHLLNLMRTINSSPIKAFEEKQVVLERREGNPSKGVLLRNAGAEDWYVQEIRQEILVAHPDRKGFVNLQGGCQLEYKPLIYDISSGKPLDIPDYNDSQPLVTQGATGKIYYKRPQWGPQVLRNHKLYLAAKSTRTPDTESSGRWIKFESWSGQDGKNKLRDTTTNKREAHRNAWHLVNLNSLGRKLPVNDDVIGQYENCIKEMAALIEERDKADLPHALRTQKAKNLDTGTFVYFKTENGKVTSMGRHYHYLEYKGALKDKVDNANNGMAGNNEKGCIVNNLAGWANEADGTGMKGRIWVEMAMGPEKENAPIEPKNLRILSSQPPKADCFYLEKGDYQNPQSEICGRKFYWHDPDFDKPMWDNQDLRKGEYAFENPEPDHNKAQWAKAETIMASEKNPIAFDFNIRLLNATSDEFNLLLTALVGLSAEMMGNFLYPRKINNWCHKIGHARPFMGSGIIGIHGIEKLVFDPQTYLPQFESEELTEVSSKLLKWQEQNLIKSDHIKTLKRVMHPRGAYKAKEEEKHARITYPYALANNGPLSWKSTDRNRHPKTFQWFANNKDRNTGRYLMTLPRPEPEISQALPVVPVANNNPGGGDQAVFTDSASKKSAKETALEAAFRKARNKETR